MNRRAVGLGLRGMAMLAAFAALSWHVMKWGGAWQTFARVAVCALAFSVGLAGLAKILVASFSERRECDLAGCGDEMTRWCDFVMTDGNACGRACCGRHAHVVRDKDYCQEHYEQEA